MRVQGERHESRGRRPRAGQPGSCQARRALDRAHPPASCGRLPSPSAALSSGEPETNAAKTEAPALRGGAVGLVTGSPAGDPAGLQAARVNGRSVRGCSRVARGVRGRPLRPWMPRVWARTGERPFTPGGAGVWRRAACGCSGRGPWGGNGRRAARVQSRSARNCSAGAAPMAPGRTGPARGRGGCRGLRQGPRCRSR